MTTARADETESTNRVEDADVYVCPAALQQQGLWFLDRLHPGAATYNIVSAFRFDGAVDRAVLQRCVDAVMERHESLRTTFAQQDNQLVQVIHPDMRATIRALSVEGHADAEGDARRLAESEAAAPFDLATGPLIRFTAISIDATASLFVVVMHHAVSDGWSQVILLKEIGDLYDAFEAGQPNPLEPTSIQYADYCFWQEQRLTPELVGRQLEFWTRTLAGAPETLELPTDRVRPSVPSGRGDTIWFDIDAATTDAARQLCRAEGVTMFMLFVSALGTLLARHSGQSDVLIGTPITGRSRPELETAVGFFANTVAIRTDFTGDPSFRDALRRTKATALQAYQNSDVPFQKVVDTVRAGGSGSHNPIFQAMCVVLPVPDAPLALRGVSVRPIDVSTRTSKFDLLVDCMERASSMHVAFEYNTDVFDRTTAERLSARFAHLVREVAARPDAPLSAVPMILDDEAALLAAWNDTDRPLPVVDNVVALVAEAAAASPEAVAVIAGDERVTYRELMGRARQLSTYLRQCGVAPGLLVGVCLYRSVDIVVALLAILEANAGYLPLDPMFPAGRLAFMVEDSGTQFVITTTDLQAALAGAFTRIHLDADRSAIASVEPVAPAAMPDGGDRAYVLYTSGSTGQPKGVQIPHRALANFLLSMRREPGFSSQDRLLALTTLSFDIAGLELFLPLICGGTVIIGTREDAVDPMAIASLLDRHDVTVLQATPATWRLLIESGWEGKRNLRILCGGEAMTRGLADRLLEKGQEVWNLYGPTETTVWSTVERVAPGTDAITVGRPIDNTQVYVVDPALRLAPHGVIGELVIGGDGLATGYLNREELTTSRFVPDPFRPGPGRRLYRTGDRARFLPDGRLECLGRMDHQVKVRGYRIELGEIEAVINADAGVKQGIAIAREEPGGETRLVAYVVPAAVSDDEHAVESWARLWDATYAGGITPGTDPTFDTSGWRSSYTSEALSADDLKEWVDHTAARIRRLAPTRVLEIGCGTGLIVYRVAPGTERYTAVDAAAGPIARLEQEAVRRGLGQVVAHVAHADKAASLVDGPVNLLVINSVAQYFPSVEYLVLVMERAMAVMPAGSHIFLGDIRNRDLLGAFGASIALAQAADESSTEEVARAAAERQARESELLFAPAFFEGLRSRLPRITRVQLATKGGRRRNEMNAFRYDVVLEIDGPGDLVEIPTRVDARGFSLGDIASRLASGQRAIAFEGIPDARNAPDLWLAGALERPTAATTTAADLRRAMADVDQGLHPEDVVALAGALDVEISPSIDHPGAFDATFRTPDALASPRTVRRPAIVGDAWRQHAREPQRDHGPLVARLKDALAAHVPGYMIPSAFVVLDAFPLTPNGKIDRNALPAPTASVPRTAQAEAAPPSTDTELAIAGFWREVLGLDTVGVDDNFFQIGGHSLGALKVFMRIESAMGISLPISTLFRAPTIRALAAVIDAQAAPDAAPAWPSVVVINDAPGPPLIGVHSLSGDVLEYRLIARHLDPGRRVIGLQAPLGADIDVESVFASIEATADHYIRELREVQPEGPYYLCGWSSGGAIGLEIAQRLIQGGATVAMFAVIDSAPFNVDVPPRPVLSRLARQVANVPYWVRDDLLATPPRLMMRRVRHKVQTALRHLSGAARSAPSVRDIVDFPQRPARWERFAELHYRAFQKYVPAPYPGRVSLISASTQPLTWLNDAARAWRHLAREVDVYRAPGTHFSIVEEPNVRVLAEAIEEAVRRTKARDE